MTGADQRQLTVRRMTPADIPRLMVHEEDLFGSESWTPDSYRAELADTRYRYYVVAELGTPTDSAATANPEHVGPEPAAPEPAAPEPAAPEPAAPDPAAPELVGWAGLMVIRETAQILTIGVVPTAQRQGIGQVVLDALLDEARRRRAVEVILEVRVDNGAARRLYERNRFTPLRVRRGYYDLGRVDALELRRVL